MTNTVNSFRSHGNFANSKMGDKKADKNVQRTRELLEDCNTLVLSLCSVKPAVMYVCVYVCLRMYLYGLNTELIDGSSKLDFQTFKIIRQFFVRVLVMRRDATTRDSHAPKSFQLICNAQCFLSFSNFTFIFQKTTIIL